MNRYYAGLAENTEDGAKAFIASQFCDKYNESTLQSELQLEEVLAGYDVLIGVLEGWGYEECAYFVLRDISTGQLYDLKASHCSCYGFEGQWSNMMETSIGAILMRERFVYDDIKDYKIRETIEEIAKKEAS
jgi:hypothetical protein